MKKLFITEEAENNLDEITSYISANFGNNTANKIEEKIINDLKKLLQFPELGKKNKDNTHSLIIERKTIAFYEIKDDNIYVLSLVDTRSNFRPIL